MTKITPSRSIFGQPRRRHTGYLSCVGVRIVYLYCATVWGWFGLDTIVGDQWWWLFLLNASALYLFVPLPLLCLVALWVRQPVLWSSLGTTVLLGLLLYGDMLLPDLPVTPLAGHPVTVMTSNLLGSNDETEAVIAALGNSGADVIALQELSPVLAEAIKRDLATTYPYQVLDPQPGVVGMGVISRYPLRHTNTSLPGAWVGRPQVLALTVGTTLVTLVNFHAIPPVGSESMSLEWRIRERERQARALVYLADATPHPVIVLGDLNATDQHTAYAIITTHFIDAWRTAGWGFGHTFPGAVSAGSSRPEMFGIPVPKWLVRIDYVFHSAHWHTHTAQIGPWDGVSDHRPVLATLVLRDDH